MNEKLFLADHELPTRNFALGKQTDGTCFVLMFETKTLTAFPIVSNKCKRYITQQQYDFLAQYSINEAMNSIKR